MAPKRPAEPSTKNVAKKSKNRSEAPSSPASFKMLGKAPKGLSKGKVKSPKRKGPSKALSPSPSLSPGPPSRSLPHDAEDEGEDDVDDQNSSSGNKSQDDENVHLHGFSSDEEDSSDEDDVDVEAPPIDVSRLPTVAKDDVTVKQRLEKAKRQSADQRGVLYISRIPHGFYEDQLKSYFSQFGDVTRLRLSRNRKTGRSKHYAFIEFESLLVAQIVAETMDNYLLMGHILKCKVIPKDEVHPKLWIGANRKWRVVPHDRVVRLKHNKLRTETQRRKSEARLLKRQRDRKRRLLEAGIKYEFGSVEYKRQTS